MRSVLGKSVLFVLTILAALPAAAQDKGKKASWQQEFDIKGCDPRTSGRNPYFVLEPGYQLVLEGGGTRLEVTVLDETKLVDGIMTRVVEEKEWKKGALYEIARNYFAICEKTKDVFYFGEDVAFYENGKVTKTDGTWHAGLNGNKAGLMMPGAPKVGMRYYQEQAPGIAMDRAEIVSLTQTCKTPAGSFANCLKVKEGTPLDLSVTEYKYYAPGIGLVRDEDLKLIKHGFVKQ